MTSWKRKNSSLAASTGSVCLLVLAASILFPKSSAQGTCSKTNAGRSFVVAFMQTPPAPTKSLTITAGSTGNPVSITVTYPNSSSFTVLANANEHALIRIPQEFELNSGAVVSRAIQVTANDSITLVGQTEQPNYSEAFLALPMHGLGTKYYVISYAPTTEGDASGTYRSQFAILATEDKTDVIIQLSFLFKGVLQFRSVNYTSGSRFSFTLNRLEALQLESTDDLTGTVIFSNPPTAVWAGNLAAKLEGSQIQNHVVEQMIPVEAAGKSFSVSPIPGGIPYAVKIVAADSNTEVTIISQSSSQEISSTEKKMMLSLSGNHLTWYQTSKGLTINSTGLIIVCQLTNTSSSPAMTVVPPTDTFLAQYNFVIPTNTSHEFNTFTTILVNYTDRGQIQYDTSFNFDTVNWDNVPGSVYAAYSAPTYRKGFSTHRISTDISSRSLGATVYGASQVLGLPFVSYAYPAGICLDVVGVNRPESTEIPSSTQWNTRQTALRAVTPSSISAIISTITTTGSTTVARRMTPRIKTTTTTNSSTTLAPSTRPTFITPATTTTSTTTITATKKKKVPTATLR